MNYLDLSAEAFLLVPLATIIIYNICPKKLSEKYFYVFAAAVAIIQIIASVSMFYLMNVLHMREHNFIFLKVLGKSGMGSLCITYFSPVFLFCIGLVSFASVMIAMHTIDAKKTHYVNLLMTLITGMNGMILVKDLFSLYVFLEIVGLSSFVMIAMFQSKKGLEGSVKYLVMSEFASIFILTALALIFMQTGSLSYDAVGSFLLDGAASSQKMMIYFSVILLISAFAIKTGAVPFHSWLPDAHQSADTAISVLLSGIVIKIAGVYSLIVLTRLFSGIEAVHVTLATIGILSIVTGALLAAKQNHFKRIIAYSSVSQMGYILLGLSTGTTLGLIGSVAHVFSHAVFKTTLFTNAGALHEHFESLDINEMGGLQSRMPVTAFSSIIAFLSTAGIPPFTGFWSKLLIVMALWTSGNPVMAGAALTASIFTSAYFLRLQKKVFFGPLPDRLSEVKEVTGSIKFIEILLTAVTITVGVLFPMILVYLQNAGTI